MPHTNRYAVGDNGIDITLDGGATSSLWWATKNEWLGLLDVAAWRWRNCTAASLQSRSTRTAGNTCSSPAVPDQRSDCRAIGQGQHRQ